MNAAFPNLEFTLLASPFTATAARKGLTAVAQWPEISSQAWAVLRFALVSGDDRQETAARDRIVTHAGRSRMNVTARAGGHGRAADGERPFCFHPVSQPNTRHGAFDAGYREQTSEGNHQRKGGTECPFSRN